MATFFQYVAAVIRSKLDELGCLAMTIDEELERLSQLRPELRQTLIGDAILRQYKSGSVDATPATTIGVRIPGGVGLILWRDQSSDSESEDGPKPVFLPFVVVPPVLQRLVIPHFEQVIDGLSQRISF